MIAFHIRANDSNGAVNQLPSDAPTRECLIRVGEAIPTGTFGTYRIWMTATTRNAWNTRSYAQVNNRPLDITFVYNDQRAIYNVGAAYNGSDNTSELYNGPDASLCGYTLNFPADEPFLNADEAVLDWPTRDETAQREQLTYWMASQVGLPHNYRRYVRLYVNGIGAQSRPQPYGNGTHVYEDLQTPGADFLEQWYDGGELYKVQVWRRDYKFPARPGGEPFHATLQNFVNLAGKQHLPRYRWLWRKRAVQDSANDYSKLLDLVAVGNAPNSPNYFAAVNAFMNVEQWMRVFAWERVIGNFDSYGHRNGHNMYAVKPSGKRWQLLTFDNDLVFGSVSDGPTTDLFYNQPLSAWGTPDPVAVTRLRDGTPAARRAYWRAFQDFVNGPMQSSNYLPQVNAQYTALQTNGVIQDSGTPVADPSSVTSWIDARRNYIQNQLATVAANFAVTAPPNNFTTNRNLVTLTGTAPVAARDITINGVEGIVTWVNVTTWSVQVVLTNGVNPIIVAGLDATGQTNFTSNLTLNFTGQVDSPEKNLVLNEIMYRGTNLNAEFVEIFNRSTSTAFNLTDWRINGLDFTFPDGTIIGPGGFLVVAKDSIAFGKAFGFHIPVAGEFNGVLDQDGETLSLIRVNGTNEFVIRAITYRAVPPWPPAANGGSHSLQLIDAAQDNQWIANWAGALPTPGSANSIATTLPQIPLVWLNEIQPTNATGLADAFGERDPWVELFNAGTSAVSLANFYLTSGYSNLTQWHFPASATIPPGMFALVWLDAQTNQMSPAEWHANFRPTVPAGSIALVSSAGGRTSIVDYLNYVVSGADRSFGAFPDAQPRDRHELYFATPGGINSDALPPPPIRINEWMAANSFTIPNPVTGDYDDWFELFNASSNSVDLTGFALTDDLTRPLQYVIPTNVVIAPYGFLLVWAEGDSRQPDVMGGLHVNFRLNAGGESIGLFGPNGQVVDVISFSTQTNDFSQGRWRDGNSSIFHMNEPTPSAPNKIPNPSPLLATGRIILSTNSGVTLFWTSQPGRTYRMQYKDALDGTEWVDVPGDVAATDGISQKTHAEPPTNSQRFYQVIALP
jgi:hypothetical protein